MHPAAAHGPFGANARYGPRDAAGGADDDDDDDDARAAAAAESASGRNPSRGDPRVNENKTASSSTRALASASHRISNGAPPGKASGDATLGSPAFATQPCPPAVPARKTHSCVAPSFSLAPDPERHSGAGAGAHGLARSARTHAWREGSGGAWLGVIANPTATYPEGAIARHAANVPPGFLRNREPESFQTSSNPDAGAVAAETRFFSSAAEGASSTAVGRSHGASTTRVSAGATSEGTTHAPSAATPGGSDRAGAHAESSCEDPQSRLHHASSSRPTRYRRSGGRGSDEGEGAGVFFARGDGFFAVVFAVVSGAANDLRSRPSTSLARTRTRASPRSIHSPDEARAQGPGVGVAARSRSAAANSTTTPPGGRKKPVPVPVSVSVSVSGVASSAPEPSNADSSESSDARTRTGAKPLSPRARHRATSSSAAPPRDGFGSRSANEEDPSEDLENATAHASPATAPASVTASNRTIRDGVGYPSHARASRRSFPPASVTTRLVASMRRYVGRISAISSVDPGVEPAVAAESLRSAPATPTRGTTSPGATSLATPPALSRTHTFRPSAFTSPAERDPSRPEPPRGVESESESSRDPPGPAAAASAPTTSSAKACVRTTRSGDAPTTRHDTPGRGVGSPWVRDLLALAFDASTPLSPDEEEDAPSSAAVASTSQGSSTGSHAATRLLKCAISAVPVANAENAGPPSLASAATPPSASLARGRVAAAASRNAVARTRSNRAETTNPNPGGCFEGASVRPVATPPRFGRNAVPSGGAAPARSSATAKNRRENKAPPSEGSNAGSLGSA